MLDASRTIAGVFDRLGVCSIGLVGCSIDWVGYARSIGWDVRSIWGIYSIAEGTLRERVGGMLDRLGLAFMIDRPFSYNSSKKVLSNNG
jgi:hypothetical protein